MSTAVRFQPLRTLDPHRQRSASCCFEVALRQRIVGQDAAVQALIELYQVFCAGLNASGHPIGNLLLLGPTGVGKTRIAALSRNRQTHWFPSRLSPACETHPLITQEALARSHRGELKLSFVLFDEIEKASDALWQLLLGQACGVSPLAASTTGTGASDRTSKSFNSE
jgi:ATP-dependent Clp protease ATP-binding subunit ClpB